MSRGVPSGRVVASNKPQNGDSAHAGGQLFLGSNSHWAAPATLKGRQMSSVYYVVERKTEGKWEPVFDTVNHTAAYAELERLWTDARTEGVRYWLRNEDGGLPYDFEVRERNVEHQ